MRTVLNRLFDSKINLLISRIYDNNKRNSFEIAFENGNHEFVLNAIKYVYWLKFKRSFFVHFDNSPRSWNVVKPINDLEQALCGSFGVHQSRYRIDPIKWQTTRAMDELYSDSRWTHNNNVGGWKWSKTISSMSSSRKNINRFRSFQCERIIIINIKKRVSSRAKKMLLNLKSNNARTFRFQ